MDIDDYFDRPCWVVDFLPSRVPKDGGGRFFAVEEYYLSDPRAAVMKECFVDVLLKLYCYYDFTVTEGEKEINNPPPADLVGMADKPLTIFIMSEDSLITYDPEDSHMTVYSPTAALLEKLGALAGAAGLFLWRS